MKNRAFYGLANRLGFFLLAAAASSLMISCGSTTPVSPIEPFQYFYGTWGTTKERWAVGGPAALLHYVQSTGTWAPSTQSQVLFPGNLFALWGLSENDVWAVGGGDPGLNHGFIFHYDGTQWSQVFKTQTLNSMLTGIWGSSEKDVWAAGLNGTLVHYDGTQWTLVDSRVPFDLFGIWGTGPNNIWMVGGGLQSGGQQASATTNMLHYDGKNWQISFSNANIGLAGIWGINDNDIWAVGGQTMIHYNGVGWNQINTNSQVPNTVYFRKLWGTSSTDIWIVGPGGSYHYDGMNFIQIPVPALVNTFISSTEPLTAIWGTSPTDIWSVAYDGIVLQLNTTKLAPEWVLVRGPNPSQN